jgi:hypothetical protein
MTTPKSLPDRPSLESLRKQAKKLVRDIAAADSEAIARARAQLPNAEQPLSQRDAQLVLAREYGYAGWQDLTAEVFKRLGKGLEWAVAQAQRIIHDNDVERLKQLLAEYPALLSWQSSPGDGGLLGMTTRSFGDSSDPTRERHFTRRECAELLIDAGAVIDPSVCEGLIGSRAKGLLQLFSSKGLLPRTLKFLAALGDIEGVRACFDERGTLRAGAAGAGSGNELAAVNDAFMHACRFRHEAVASFLLDRCIALDSDLGKHIEGWRGRAAFIQYLGEHDVRVSGTDEPPGTPWQAFLMQEVHGAILSNELPKFTRLLQSESWLLGEPCVRFQVRLVGTATLNDRAPFITTLLDLDPALLRRRPPPQSQAISCALVYAKAHLVPLLTRIWPLPDDLPHAAGMGDFARVKRWFDAAGQPALGDPAEHTPGNNPHERMNLQWGPPNVQQVLDTALAWACLNRHLEIADFLLEHGADINTDWSSHEPASILHELVFHENYEAMQFLIDRGIDMTIVDYRWGGTAQGWAFHAANNPKMADWLAEAERQQNKRRP